MRVCPRATSIAGFTQLLTVSTLRPFGIQSSSCLADFTARCSAKHSVAGPAEPAEGGGNGVLPEDGPIIVRTMAIPRHERKVARKSRSFRRRQAPITRGQRRKLRELWPKHGLVMDFNQRWDFGEIFSTTPGATVTFDIGFGAGESLIEMAAARPKEYFVGIEVHKPGVAAALSRLEEEGLTNVKIAQGDAITALTDHVEDGSLSACCIFFPDPFPQDRDAGRRLVRPLLLSLLSSKLRAGGALHVATDVQAYAEHTVGVVERMEAPENLLKSSSSSMPSWPPRAATEAAQDEEQKERLGEPCDEGNLGRTDHPPRASVAGGLPGRPQRQQQEEEVAGGLPGRPQRQQQKEEGRRVAASRLASNKEPVRWVGGVVQQRPPWRPLTRYEKKAREAGRVVRDLSYRFEVQPVVE